MLLLQAGTAACELRGLNHLGSLLVHICTRRVWSAMQDMPKMPTKVCLIVACSLSPVTDILVCLVEVLHVLWHHVAGGDVSATTKPPLAWNAVP